MRRSIKHWLDWLMTDLLKLASRRPSDQSVHLRYEKAGLTLHGSPVPWNADAVVVEMLAHLPPAARTRSDYVLRVPGHEPVPAEALRKEGTGEAAHRIFFRVAAVPLASTTAEVLWKNRLLATVPIDVQTSEHFFAGLRLATPTVSVRLGAQSVAAQTFIAAQCRGVTAAAVLRSPAPLAALADTGVRVVFRSDRGTTDHPVVVPLSSTQLAGREALLTASPPTFPKRAGAYSVTWMIGDREIHTQRITAITSKRFLQSLRVSDSRFVVAGKLGAVRAARTVPPTGEFSQLGPCFVLASKEVGAAGLLPLQVNAVVPGAARPQVLFEQTVLVTDGPTVFAPGLIDMNELSQVSGFELRHKDHVLGLLSLSPVPAAAFTAEGGFKPPPDFAWSNTAEEELNERLGKLFEMRDSLPPSKPSDGSPWL